MSDSSAFDFGKFIPGFDFLQNLAASGKGAAGPVGGLHNWVAPTVSVDELDKRIQELKAVLFWLEQNGTALKATIQALEVQKMTLATLQGMNLSMAEVARAFTLPTQGTPAAAPSPAATPEHWPFAAAPAPQPAAAPTPAAEPEPQPEPTPEPEPPAAAAPKAAPARKRPPPAAAPAPAAAGLADPMQWWGALTQQFQQIAAETLREAARAVPAPAGFELNVTFVAVPEVLTRAAMTRMRFPPTAATMLASVVAAATFANVNFGVQATRPTMRASLTGAAATASVVRVDAGTDDTATDPDTGTVPETVAATGRRFVASTIVATPSAPNACLTT